MKTLLISISLLISLNSMAASNEVKQSELKLRGCLSLVYSNAANFKGESKEVTKMVSAGTKQCREEVKAMKKQEAALKKRSKLEAQLKKLQAKLSDL